MRVAPLGTGHNAHPLSTLGNSVLVRTSLMSGISLRSGSVRVEAGAVWGPIAEQAGASGFAALHGSSPDAGVVGYTLGGGVNWYGRSRGLAVNSVTAVELITADGTLVRADADHETDLFWALRGGGAANFGLVTARNSTCSRSRASMPA
jgi:FAD/FMN-containing dehydrogenase